MEIRYKTLSEQLYADSDYLTKLANKPSMRNYCQEIINATIDINRAAFKLGHPEEKTGKWKVQHTNLSHLPSDTIVTCLECGHTKSRIDGEILNFCPKCGAKMVSE